MTVEEFIAGVRASLAYFNFCAGLGYVNEEVFEHKRAEMHAEIDKLVLARAKTLNQE